MDYYYPGDTNKAGKLIILTLKNQITREELIIITLKNQITREKLIIITGETEIRRVKGEINKHRMIEGMISY